MSKNQDYNINSKKVLQSNNTVTCTVSVLSMKHSHKKINNEFEPPLKKKKIHSVTTKKLTSNVQHNNNTSILKSACKVSGCTMPNIVFDKGERSTRKMETASEISCQTENDQLFSILDLSNNAKAIKFYTGCNDYEQFMRVFGTLGPDKYDLTYFDNDQPVNLSLLDQFLIVLILLKQHKSHYEISIMFNITLKDIKNIFITWIRFMRLEWSNIRIKKAKISNQKLSSSSTDRKSDVGIQSNNEDSLKIIDAEDDQLNPSDCLRKMYKVLSDGPANYIESHLVKDIQFVCQRLQYFTASNNNEVITITLKR